MTSRRKNKKDIASEDGSSSSRASQSPSSVTSTGRPKRSRTSTASSNESPSSPPRKGKRNASADSDQELVTPRKGGRGRGRSTPSKTTPIKESPAPKGRGRGRRGSIDSNASSIGGSSVISAASTPSTRRSGRNRRGSSSSEVSVLSDVSITPPDSTVQQTGRGRKRGATKSPTVVAKKTNGNSPSSKSTPRKRGRASPESSPVDNSSEKNGHSSRKGRRKGTVAESPPEKVLDGGTDNSLENSKGLNNENDLSTKNGKNVLENHDDSSQVQNACKRRLSNGTASDIEVSPDRKPKPDKRIKPVETIVNDVISKSEKSGGVPPAKSKCDIDIKSDKKESVNSKDDDDMDTLTVFDKMLSDFELSDEQTKEIIALIPRDIQDGQEELLIEKIVPILIGGAGKNIKHMNAPRFNKFLRQLLNRYCDLDCNVEKKYDLCQKCVEWAREKKVVNLRHELEVATMELYYKTGEFRKAEVMANAIYNETKKLQDKEKNVKACLCLSQSYQAMGNISKARANITTAKTEALNIYTPPNMQGELDMQSGSMDPRVSKGGDIKINFEFFKKSKSGFSGDSGVLKSFFFTFANSKIMIQEADEGEKIVRSSSHLADIDEGVEAMLSISKAATMSSLKEFKTYREKYAIHLEGDPVVASVLNELYTSMMEKNMLKIIMPYERVQITQVAELINLPREEVERRLSQMILDKRLSAQLDHRDDCLYLYNSQDKDIVYSSALETLTHLDKTVTHLNHKVKKLL
ncbi:unnamed protein product [Meganyctiphanes norvegica]|uniref:PCI domain-containing protein n=1 Tax=Meganyctiphanes norvegica TaxID=48144 RepID=A0AAV2PH25_MEGNR